MTFVLVHGGWHGGWCWVRVARLLRAKGHDVWTPTLTGLGERSHLLRADLTTEMGVQDVMALLEAEELKQVVLVGHSSGGVTISGVADRMHERVAALIYLDGLIIHDGESLATYFTPPQAAAYQVALAECAASFPPPPAAVFDIPNGPDADWVNRRLTPQPFGTATSSLRLEQPVGSGIPCAYIACTGPSHPFVGATHEWVKMQRGWQWREVPTGHDAMITEPESVGALFEELALKMLREGLST